MDSYIYLKEGEIQKEDDERHLKNGWESIPKNYIGQANMGFFQIRRKVMESKLVSVKEETKDNLSWIQKIIKRLKRNN